MAPVTEARPRQYGRSNWFAKIRHRQGLVKRDGANKLS